MATTTTNFGWDIPQSTDLVKDGATAIAALGQDIDTALVDLKGGTTGQVLSKASNTDLDYSWVAVDPLLILDAKGDLITATAADTPARLPVGTNNQVLTADSSTATGLKWATAGGSGKVLQVIQATTTTSTTIASTTYTDTTLSATITPTLATSKILVFVNQRLRIERVSDQQNGSSRLMRDATAIYTQEFATQLQATGASGVVLGGYNNANYLDSPATTSAITYKTQGKVGFTTSSGQIVFQENSSISSIILMEIGA
jgi:hypothetical protein